VKRKGAEGLPASHEVTPAANEEFTGAEDELTRQSYSHAGWDPYEVWRTRVKASARSKQQHERDPLG